MNPAFPIAVMVSGSGSNLQALLDTVHGRDGIEVAVVVSSKPGVKAIERARSAGVRADVFEKEAFADRAARDAAVGDLLSELGVRLIVLAGWMEILTPGFIDRFEGRIINVHPSLLPSFPGIRAVEQALEHGVKVTGVTVHHVDHGVDTGPIIAQRAVEVPAGADADALLELLHPLEHELLPEAVRAMAAGMLAP